MNPLVTRRFSISITSPGLHLFTLAMTTFRFRVCSPGRPRPHNQFSSAEILLVGTVPVILWISKHSWRCLVIVLFVGNCRFNMLNKIARVRIILWNFVTNKEFLLVFCLVNLVFVKKDRHHPFRKCLAFSTSQSCHLCLQIMQSMLVAVIVDKQRVLMHGHQGWNVRPGLCHIYMRYVYIYIWVVYRLCFFCCLFITVTWWYVWCIEWASGNQGEVQACLVTLWLFIISCYSLYKTTLDLLCSWFENNPHFHKYSMDFHV